MKNNFRLLSVILLITLSCQSKKQTTSETALSSKLDSIFNATPGFSGVVLVAENGTPVYHKAFGNKDFRAGTPNDTTAIFEIASVSKQFTAMIIMMLEEQGLLRYDDSIEKFIPGLPYHGITIRHLLNHTSGLPDYQAIMDQHWDKSKVAGNDDNIAYLIQYKPAMNFAPGEKYEYSNTGYMLLASIAEKASGKDFIQLCRDKIFTPLEMTSTDVRTKAEKLKLPAMAWGHLYVPEKQRYIAADSFPAFNYALWLGDRKGPGRVSSTASDLLKWDKALYTEQLVKKQSIDEAFTPATLNDGSRVGYGFGWKIRTDPEVGKVVYHDGDNPGYKTRITRFIDLEKTVIMLCNNAHHKYAGLLSIIEAEMK